MDRELADLTATLTNVLQRRDWRSGHAATAQDASLQTARDARSRDCHSRRRRPNRCAAPGAALHFDAASRRDRGIVRGRQRPRPAVRGVLAPITSDRRRQSYVFMAGTPLADATRERREAQEAMALGMPVAVAPAAGGGLWLALVGCGRSATWRSAPRGCRLTGWRISARPIG